MQTLSNPLKTGWSYQHDFGVIHIESWGKPFLIVTEHKYYDGQGWGYNYYKLFVSFESPEAAKAEAARLNTQYSFPAYFDSANSEAILLTIQQQFPHAEIAKPQPC